MEGAAPVQAPEGTVNVGQTSDRIIELIENGDSEGIEQLERSDIYQTVYSRWNSQYNPPGLISKLLKWGSEDLWFTHFHLRMNEANAHRLTRDDLADINEAIALAVAKECPNLLLYEHSKERSTIVHLTAKFGSATSFESLLTFAKGLGDDRYIQPFKIKDKKRKTPMAWAVEYRCGDENGIGIIKALLENTDVEIDEDSLRSAIEGQDKTSCCFSSSIARCPSTTRSSRSPCAIRHSSRDFSN
jgi:hypothetical protein